MFNIKPVQGLPPAPAARLVAAEAVLGIAERLNGKDWKAIQSETRALGVDCLYQRLYVS